MTDDLISPPGECSGNLRSRSASGKATRLLGGEGPCVWEGRSLLAEREGISDKWHELSLGRKLLFRIGVIGKKWNTTSDLA